MWDYFAFPTCFPYNAHVPVRRLQRRDHSRWFELRGQLWPECQQDRHLIEMKDILTQPKRKAVFVFDRGHGRLGGFLEVSLRETIGDSVSPVVGYIEGWWVDPDLRRSGVGTLLISSAEAWVRSLGLTEMASDADLANEVSHAAHRALGYREVERLICYCKRL